MRVAVVNLTGGDISGGLKKYLLNVLPRMAADWRVESVLCASPGHLDVRGWFGPFQNVRFVACKPFKLWGGGDWSLVRELGRYDPHVLFIPLERYFRFRDIPVVNMVQNMLPMVPVPHRVVREKVRNAVLKSVAAMAVKRSQRVIAVSKFVREHLVERWSLPLDKTCLVYFGSTPFSGAVERPSCIPLDWGGRFLFAAGSIDPYRGLEDVLRALKLLSESRPETRLVVAGTARRSMSGYWEKLKGLARELGVHEMVFWAGTLSENEMAWSYRNCRVFVVSSRVEACPNIVLESMSSGCVSVSADSPPMPEFYEDAAIYYATGDARSMAKQVSSALDLGEPQRAAFSDRATRRASAFSWDETAGSTVGELRSISNG